MCCIFFRTGTCPDCEREHLTSWKLSLCKETYYCVGMEYCHCGETDIIYNGKVFRYGEDTQVTPWPKFCNHDGWVMLGEDQVYTNSDLGYESLNKSYLLPEGENAAPPPYSTDDTPKWPPKWPVKESKKSTK